MGPKTTRLNPASQPSLTQPGLGLLQGLFGPGLGGGGAGGQGPLRQQGPGSTVLDRLGSTFGTPIQGGFDQFSGQGVLNAAQPLFQRNLQDALGLQREQGPRFSSGQNLLGMQTTQRALQDFNEFAQQVLQQGQQTKLQAMLGQGAQQGALLQQLLGALFKGGGINAAPIYQQTPGLGQQLLGLAGTLGGAALGGGMFGGGKLNPNPGGQLASQFDPSQLWNIPTGINP